MWIMPNCSSVLSDSNRVSILRNIARYYPMESSWTPTGIIRLHRTPLESSGFQWSLTGFHSLTNHKISDLLLNCGGVAT